MGVCRMMKWIPEPARLMAGGCCMSPRGQRWKACNPCGQVKTNRHSSMIRRQGDQQGKVARSMAGRRGSGGSELVGY